MIILTDTREQTPLPLKNITKATLKTGDYTIQGHETKISIERKTPQDLHQTLTRGITRFKKELERARTMDWFCILITCTDHAYTQGQWKGSWRSKIKPETTRQTLQTLSIRYNVHYAFVKDDKEATKFVQRAFKCYLREKAKEAKQNDQKNQERTNQETTKTDNI